MEEAKTQQENDTTESLPSSSSSSSSSSSASQESSRRNSVASDGKREAINPININNGPNTVHQDLSTEKHRMAPEAPLNSSAKLIDPSRNLIDTAAPFQSVKAAVNMFGGNVDWKAQRALAKERNRNFEQELEKAEQELPLYLKQLEEAEEANTKLLQELETTQKQVEDLKLQLEKAQTESSQAHLDCELAQLRVTEIEQGISHEHSVAAKEQVKVAKRRHFEADNELKSVEAELDALKKQLDQLIKEKDIAVKNAEEALFSSNEAEKTVEKLTIELISVEAKAAMKISSPQADQAARRELTKAMEEAELAKASARAVELRVQAVLKEIEAAKASESLSIDAIKAVEESEGVETIPLEEYSALRNRADEAERIGNEKVTAAFDRIKDAERAESMSREKLEAFLMERKEMKEALRDAAEKAERAKEGKLKMEQELREWRAESERRRKAGEADACSEGQSSVSAHHYWRSFDDREGDESDAASAALRVNSAPNPKRRHSVSEVDDSVSQVRPGRKKSFFPRLIMMLAARKKAHQPLN